MSSHLSPESRDLSLIGSVMVKWLSDYILSDYISELAWSRPGVNAARQSEKRETRSGISYQTK